MLPKGTFIFFSGCYVIKYFYPFVGETSETLQWLIDSGAFGRK